MKLSDKCRLCLIKSSTNSDDIFFPIDSGFERKFSEITNGRVKFAKPKTHEEIKKFPDKVCMSCVSKLEQHYNYRNGLIEKQKRLNSLLGIDEEIEDSTEATVETEELEAFNSEIEDEVQDEEEQTQELNDFNIDESRYSQVTESTENINEISMKEPDTIEKFESECETENCETEGENYEHFSQIDEQVEELFEEHEAVESGSEENNDHFVDESLNTVIEDLTAMENLEDLEEIDSYEHESESYVCIVKDPNATTDSDEEYDIVFEDDIAMEEGPGLAKRKYNKQPKDTPRQYKCWVKNCGVTFSFRSTMKKHMEQTHSIVCDKATCFMCGDRYDNYAYFLAHVKQHTRKSECDVCKLTFINDEKLHKHKSRFHKKNDDERRFPCHICNAKFKRKEHVNSHIIYKHSDNTARKFTCSECPSTFLTRQDQKNHEKSHSQVKIKCVYCPYQCRDLKSIKRHCVKLHQTLKIYRCSCDETFELFREMQVHKKNCIGLLDNVEN